MEGAKTESFTRALYSFSLVLPMDKQLWEWKLGVERIWSAAAPRHTSFMNKEKRPDCLQQRA